MMASLKAESFRRGAARLAQSALRQIKSIEPHAATVRPTKKDAEHLGLKRGEAGHLLRTA
jgi:hypothetical protein